MSERMGFPTLLVFEMPDTFILLFALHCNFLEDILCDWNIITTITAL